MQTEHLKKISTPHGRSLVDFENLNSTEEKLIADAALGKTCTIGKGRPAAATKENTIRASLLRFLLLGGDEQAAVHEMGIIVQGAWIEGHLNLENTTIISALICLECTFSQELILQRCNIPGGIFLEGSLVPGIHGDGLKTAGDVFLRDKFCSTKTVRLAGSTIEGGLDCSNSTFNGNGDDAIVLDGAVIKNGVYFRDEFKSVGAVRLPGAKIEGDLDCENASFNGNGNEALVASKAQVSGRFFFRNLKTPAKNVWLPFASVEVLVDDPNSWGNDLVLDGFTYGSIGGGAPATATARLQWLDKQKSTMSGLSKEGTEFRPQPWKQLEKTLREMGHIEDARQVAIAFEDRLRKADLVGVPPPHWGPIRRSTYRSLSRGFHKIFRALTGYGHRPMRLLMWMLAIWLGCALLYWYAALPPNNAFAPSNPLVFQNADYKVCIPGSPDARTEKAKPAKADPVAGAGNWYLCEKLREEYTGFSPLAYSLDVILPLVDLQQEHDWAPMIPTPEAGPAELLTHWSLKHVIRIVLWFEILFGWLASLLLVAIVSGLTKRQED